MIEETHLDQLLEIVGNIGTEIVPACPQFARRQFLIADVEKQQRLHTVDDPFAAAVYLIKDGILVGYMAGRDTAMAANVDLCGCVRAEYWGRLPMIRIGNVNLQHGTTPVAELFDGIKNGVYMESNRSWSIDDKRLNFQFGCQLGYEIKNGKKGKMLKNPTYAGMTPKFWGSCDAIGDKDSWVAWGTPNCGKGEPMQTARSCQAASPSRFRNVDVGVVGYDR